MRLKPNKTQFLPHEHPAPHAAGFVVLPIPYERTTSYMKGAKNGPGAILKASCQLELWDEELEKETWKEGIFTLAPFKCAGGEKTFFGKLERSVSELLTEIKGTPIFLGGEHSVTQGLLPSFQRKYRGLSILHFDAHADLRKEYEGTAHSHACALHPASRTSVTVQVGIRSVAHDERHNVNAGLVKTHLMHENHDISVLEEKILNDLSDTVYMTIDADGFDPSVMPGTGTPQPGGFMWNDALRLFKAVCLNKTVVGLDLVEVRPVKGTPITEFNAAKLIYRLMGYISEGKRIRD